jgi:SAM-dependent methyltransferase
MQYEPIKRSIGGFFRKSISLKKILYFLLDLLLLRSWHVRKALRQNALSLPKESTVLDAGSGFGQYTWRISTLYRNWKIRGVDINKEEIDACNDFFRLTGRSERVMFETIDLTLLNDKDQYDLILSVDVMEHIEEDRKVFLNFFNALKNNGILIISTPSDKGGSDVHHEKDTSFIDEHVRDGYSKEEITGKLLEAGFTGLIIRYTYGKAGHLSWILSMKYPVKMLNTSYLFFIILPFYYVIFFPIAILLNIFDVYSRRKSGTGLLVTAFKNR